MDILSRDEIEEQIGSTSWSLVDDELQATVTKPNFVEALDFVNAVGALAEEMDHHPDIAISYNTVTLRLSTHSAGGITALDTTLARRIDELNS